MDISTAGSFGWNGTVDVEAQRGARDAIMEIPLFPNLTVALRGALGYGPHVDMLQHFCYWMHPRHPKMQNRWTMYKTYAEWRDECALSDRQIRKGRKVLRERGLVTEKRSNYGRIDYRVDWVALAETLGLDANTVQGQFGRYSDESSLDANTVHANAEKHAGEYEQENSPLQGAPEPAFAEPGALEINRDKEQKKGIEAPPPTDKRHSQAAEPPKPKISKVREVKAWGLIFGLPDETDASRFADHHIAGKEDANGEPFTVERVAEKVRELCGGDEPIEAYMPWVERCLDDKRAEAAEIEAAS